MIPTTDRLAVEEAKKYEKIWSHDSYRKVSPGELEMHRAFDMLDCRVGESLNDYGSGPARATKWFQDHGLDVMGIDHASNAAETDVTIQIATLWDMVGTVAPADYAFCCDVMEHIPMERVDAVLAEIRALTRRGGWFRIATRPDVMGPRLIGAPLHLTVKEAHWWENLLRQHWTTVVPVPCGARDAVFMTLV